MTIAHDRLDIVALGEPLIEFNQTRAADPRAYVQGFGGDTSNMAIAAARLGARSGYVTRLGGDSFGRLFRELWAEEGVDMRGVAIDADAATGIYFVTHGAQGHEFSYLRAGSAASRMRPETLPLDVVRSARLLHVSGISQAISASACDTVFAAIDEANAAGALVTYDPNLRLKLWPAAAGARDDPGDDGSLQLVRAEPRRCIGAVRRRRRCGSGDGLSSSRRARGGLEARRRRLHRFRRRAPAARSRAPRHAGGRDRGGRLLRRRVR